MSDETPLVEGHKLELVASATQTEAGSCKNIMTFRMFDSDGADVTDNYSVVLTGGAELKVEKRVVLVSTGSDEWVYDGERHTSAVFTTDYADDVVCTGLLGAHSAAISDPTYVTEVGEVPNKPGIVITADGADETDNYEIKYDCGSLKITARRIAVTSSDGEWTYDGKAHSEHGHVLSCDFGFALAEGHHTEVVTDTKITDVVYDGADVGVTNNDLTVVVKDAKGNDKTSNYDITYIAGSLKINPREAVVTADDASFVYDGDPHSSIGHNAVGLADGHTTVVSYSTATEMFVNVGGTDNYVYVTIADESGADRTVNYKLIYAPGKLKILPRPIEITSGNKKKVYDGDALSCDDFSVTGGLGLVKDDRVFVVSVREITDAGVYDNVLTFGIKSGADDRTANYEIRQIYGKLTVSPRPVTVTTESKEWIYDGKAHSHGFYGVSEFDAAAGTGKLAAHTAAVDTTGGIASVTEVKEGKVENRFAVKLKDGDGYDVTGNYDVTYVYGKLSVARRKVFITTKDKSWTYDGEKHTFTEFTAAATDDTTGVVAGQTAVVDDTKSIASVTEVREGKAENKFTVAVYLGGADKSDNYNVVYTCGKIWIEKRLITVSLDDRTVVYDGAAHNCDSASVTAGSLVADHSLSFAVTPNDGCAEHINAGTHYDKITRMDVIEVGLSGYVVMTGNYEISGADSVGTLTINKRPITITSDSEEWIYDGAEHSHDKFVVYVVTSDLAPALVKDHKIGGLSTTATITNAGSKDNEYDDAQLTITDAGGNDVKDNYAVTFECGKLTVKPRPITLTSASKEWPYDGNAHSYDKFDGPTSEHDPVLVDGHKINYPHTTASIINVGWIYNSYPHTATVTAAGDVDVTANYAITYEDGRLSITPRPITLTAGSDEKVYDGTPLTCNAFTEYGLLNGHKTSVSDLIINGSQTNAGSSPNTIDRSSVIITDDDGNDITGNYAVELVPGTLTVTKKPITVQAKDTEKVYDGKEQHCDAEVADGSLVGGHTLETASSYSADDCEHHINAGVHSDYITDVFVLDANGRDVTDNYDISVSEDPATLIITKRHIEVRAGNTWTTYDGTPKYIDNFVIINGNEGYNDVLFGVFESIDGHSDDGHIEIGEHRVRLIGLTIYNNLTGDDMTDNYDVVVSSEPAILYILQRHIAVMSGSAKKVYDGTPLTCNDVELDHAMSTDTLLESHVLVGECTGEIIFVGQCPNPLVEGSVRVLDGEGNDVSEMYEIEYSDLDGILIVVEDTGSGGGWGNLDLSGDISKTPNVGDGESVVVFRVGSDTAGDGYFRIMSFGDYNGDGWNVAPVYGGAYNASFLSAYALELAGAKKHDMTITAVEKNVDYMQPYYSVLPGYTSTDDTAVANKTWTSYDVQYMLYTYSASDTVSLKGTAYENYELAYREFVKENYLRLPDDTRRRLIAIASENGLIAGNRNIIRDVAEFVSNKVEYNINFQDYVGDVALFFFEQAKTGICQHYATAATAMYRALGIPARYTVGFSRSTVAGETVDVTSMNAHAWVEAYIDGMGWVCVEVTGSGNGSGNGSGGGSGSGSGSGSGGGSGKMQVVVKPVDIDKVYDGVELLAPEKLEGNDVWDKLVNRGFGYKVTVNGSRTEIGRSESNIIELKIYDRMGNDVTDDYEIIFKPGAILVTPPQIVVTVYSLQKQYDGTPLSYGAGDYYVSSIPEGYRLELELSGSLTEVGKLSFDEVKAASHYKVYHNGVDVTNREGYAEDSEFYLKFDGDKLKVDRRNIEITSGSASKAYDGTPLTCDDFRVSGGSLARGHKITVDITGTITDVGFAANIIADGDIVIKDAEGRDVTKCYEIFVAFGRLIVTE